jgi:DNA-binding transcriptional LysR family regulator
MLDVRRLRLLREVALRGSITRAADALSYTPSAVSQQLAVLERECGIALVEREGRGIRLTGAARSLVSRTERILEELEHARADLEEWAADLTGTVRIAAFPTAARAILPCALEALSTTSPNLEPVLVEAEPDESLLAVGLGTVDVAVAHEYDLFPDRDTDGLHRTDLLTEPMLLVQASGNGVGDGEPVRLGAFGRRRWILPPVDSACGRLVERACGLAGFEPAPLARSNDFAVACALAARGHAVALVPALALDPLPPGVVAGPIEDVPVRRRVFAAVRAGAERRPALTALLDALRAGATRSGPNGSDANTSTANSSGRT